MKDLLFHLPFRWEDRTTVATVAQARASGEGDWTVRGRLTGLGRVFTRRRGLQVVRGVVSDATGELPVVWFNRPLASFKAGEEAFLLHGRIRAGKSGLEMLSPTCEPVETALHSGRITPVYPAIRGLGAPLLRRILDGLLEEIDLADVPEPLPDDLLARHGLPPLGAALAALHRPSGESGAALLNTRRSPAHLRLIYGELLQLQLELALRRAAAVSAPKPHRCRVDERVREAARAALPFKLTGAQKRALREIVEDLQGARPMHRLLQGDVGSGKTVVAALALVVALENGLQGAFLAPTELLAEQHFASLERMLGARYRLTLLTGSLSSQEAAARRAALAAGEAQLVVGTHALLEERVTFRALGLAVIDEQHRFGVEQRRALLAKGTETGERPDVLVMTATPIPRSLALAAYGDLDVSTLDELPPGRAPVATEVLPAGRRKAVYARLRRDLDAGARAYVVVPRIDEGEGAAVSIEEAAERVGHDLAPHPVAVLHGRLPLPERAAALTAFAEGTVRVLVATTVIEVGIDVPAATWMVIEDAERFGLAQLHQLRGRVGRGPTPSICVALVGKASGRTAAPETRARLEAFAATTDGFQLAEADLALRGAGDLLGTRQAGLPPLRVADLAADRDWLEKARDDARELLDRMRQDERTAPRLAEMLARARGEA